MLLNTAFTEVSGSPGQVKAVVAGSTLGGAAAVAVAVAAPGRRKPHPVSSTEAATVSDSARARPRLVVRAVPVGPDVRYQLTADLVERYWDQNSVGALVASPANPTGTMLSRDELAALSVAIKARNGHLVVDEIYHGLTYGCDAASVLEVDDSAFVLNSFSKYFGMTGWRLGWLVAPPEAVADLEKLAQNLYISAPSMAQYAALACFEPQTLAILEERRAEFGRRRDFLLPALRELGFGIAVEPEGAFYLYADISAFGGDAFAFCQHFLETQHVAFTPGLDFGRFQSGHHVRFAYTQSLPRLQEAVERIALGLKSWKG